MTRRQCSKCPWRVGVDPLDIPGGYSEEMHAGLHRTIAEPGRLDTRVLFMACHETPVGAEKPCVGWLAHQLGPGNNIALRLAAMAGEVDTDFETVGPQHERFEDTLPRKRAMRRRR